MELQGAIVLAMMDCSNEYVRKASDKSSRLVTLLYDQSPIVRVLGNLMVAVAALCVHCAAVIAVHLCSSAATLAEAAAKCRFPGLSHRVFLVCFHGLVLQSLLGLRQQSDDTSTQVAACVGLFACIGVPVLVIVQCTRATSNVAYSPYLVALEKYPRCIRTLLLPRGWWQRREAGARCWGSLFFFTAGPSRQFFCLLPYARPVATSLAVVLVEVSCAGRLVFLGCVHALLVVAVLLLRPHRVGLAGWNSVTMDLLLLSMILITLGPESEGATHAIPWIMSAMGLVSVVSAVGQVVLQLLERRWVRHEESASAAHGALSVPLQDANDKSGGHSVGTLTPHLASSNPLQDMPGNYSANFL